MGKSASTFQPLQLAMLTVSDSRDASSDTSGDYLREAAAEAGHSVIDHAIVPDNVYRIRAIVSRWIASEDVQVVIINGGTGFNAKNSTPEALLPLFDREIDGFGELFRMVSYEDIGGSTLQSRAVAGLANQTLIFAVPGSTSACTTAWERIIADQLDARTRPCNFVTHLKKL
ncbi:MULTISPECIES: molybdenum cofactor biosynthesis protein B [Pantoea]|uniref:Molybdenum cofactor biosynthesis protein B n=1 Tax=Pantoea stewartii subsp. stewartii DC283 TaxID=660596 RepID=H3RAY5_PANSE|nr:MULTISPECIES: molybdenum cofactor biosynthesis protein B [Pantoea]KKW51857.1 molybdopterin biosynthesis protein B [Pantoea ananatis]ARF49383.1 molybdenum cofactor biosynthesis protein B [Pantoea stewartii subsp. stewartii DC283]EHU01431.1 molybdopterin biosynthesis protein B [Pantoea stewartii subsp. stewartii DC283]KAB0552056.1 molybdenum cofactor biosynthesis protein B [Pantoea stewartii subsp. stewartii]KGD85259.1 molybdopterin biosynthesis protein B [Pantoea stewartii subsp. indologenes